ncbi:uncharacterized protein [Dysidea avara]|uniref:uncharacterized protein n=1 Tax=Dysidea avara TaxID=196820 RepID=UPI003333031A
MESSQSIPSSLRSCIIENIQLGRQIGYGANGRILEAKWEGAAVAVKEIHSIFNQVSEPEFQAFKQSFLRECEQSNQLRHPNIVRFFGIYLPPGARLPSLVMEQLHCSLNNLLEQTPVVPIGTKLSILYDVSLGIRYLHSRNPPIIHRDLSSNNVLLTKGMEAKIGDLGTARLVDPRRQSQMTKAPGTVDFMPPEALAANPQSVRYGRELDVFSFGCVMLHTLSHQWPTPSEAVVTDPVTFEVKGRTEVERRSQYFNRIDRSRLGVLIPLIESSLSNLLKNRTSIVTLCEQLEGLVDREHVPTGDLDLLQQEIQRKNAIISNKDEQIQNQVVELQTKDAEIQRRGIEMQRKDAEIQRKDAEIQRTDSEIQRRGTEIQRRGAEIQRKDAEIQRRGAEVQRKNTEICNKDVEIEALRSNMSKLQVTASHLTPKKVSNRSIQYWNSLKLTWQHCADLPEKYWAYSVTKLDNKVYITPIGEDGGCFTPLMYEIDKDKWSVLLELPYFGYCLVAVPDKK